MKNKTRAIDDDYVRGIVAAHKRNLAQIKATNKRNEERHEKARWWKFWHLDYVETGPEVLPPMPFKVEKRARELGIL